MKQELDSDHEDPAVQFDSDFAFMTLELSKFIDELMEPSAVKVL